MAKVIVSEVKLVHRISGQRHRLEAHDPVKEPEVGEWALYKEVAVLGCHRATTDYFDNHLPSVFKVVSVNARIVQD